MISADRVLPLWLKYREALETPIRTFEFPKFNKTFEDKTYQMGVLNLSPDSTYRETVCHTLEAAVYRGRKMTLEGAAMVDIGAESTGDTADVVSVERQIDRMRPVVKALADENILVSVETYHPEVGIALLEAGAGVINLTGRVEDTAFYQAIGKHEAGIVLCYTPGENARSMDILPPVEEIFDHQLMFFKDRIARATDAGIERLWVDPGFGFSLNLPDGPDRIRYQTDSILQSFRLRELGWPVTVQLTGHVYLFRDEVRVAQTSAATLAVLSKANLVRSHEVSRVQPVLNLQDYA
ncbi:MAG: dihydropteroate synthase [Roseibium sp.]